MKLVQGKYNLLLPISEDKPSILVIENPDVMTEFVSSLIQQSAGNEGDFLFVNGEKSLDFQKSVELVIDPFSVDFNNKKVLSSLFSNLSRTGNDFIEKKSDVLQKSITLLEFLVSKENFIGITYNSDFDWTAFFKMFGVQFENEYESLLVKLTEYLKLLSSFSKCELIVFVNLSSYLSQNDLNQLLKTALYCKIKVVFIESSDILSFSKAHVCVIDKDQCLITR